MEFNEAFTLAVKSVVMQLFKPDIVCEVLAVDKETNLCSVKETGSGLQIDKVRLLSVEMNPAQKFVVYPKVGSLVSVAYLFIASDEAQVMKYSETESMQLNGSEFGGLAKTEKVAERLKRIEDAFAGLQAKFNAHTHVLALTAGTGTAAIPALPSEESVMPKTTQEYISNENVKHG